MTLSGSLLTPAAHSHVIEMQGFAIKNARKHFGDRSSATLLEELTSLSQTYYGGSGLTGPFWEGLAPTEKGFTTPSP